MATDMPNRDPQEFRPDSGERTRARPVFTPRTDIYETGDAIVVEAELPGVVPDAVDITLEKRVLTIRGPVEARDRPGFRPAYTEFRPGDFERVFTLSNEIDQDRITATHQNGVLQLVLPKAAPAAARKIQVQAG